MVTPTKETQREGLWTLLHPLFLWQLPQGRELRVLPPGTQRIQVEVGQGVKKYPETFLVRFFNCFEGYTKSWGIFFVGCRKEIFLPKATSLKHLETQKMEKTLDLGVKTIKTSPSSSSLPYILCFLFGEMNSTSPSFRGRIK